MTTFLLSAKAMGFQGYIMADCGFQDAHGFGFITGRLSYRSRATLAQGYLAVVHEVINKGHRVQRLLA